MDEDGIIRLCITAFKPEDILAAKNLLFESLRKSRRKVLRKREGKSQRELEDIISTIKEVDPEELPIFVARDLHKLPPVTFDHIDVTRLLKDLITLRNELEYVKEDYVNSENFTQLKNEVTNLKQASLVKNFECNNYVNRIRGSANLQESFNCESGPIGIIHIPPETTTSNIHTKTTVAMSQCTTSGTRSAPAQRFPSPSRAPDGESSVSVTQRIEVPVEAHAEVSNVSETALLASSNEHRIDPERATTQTNTQMSMSDLVRSNNNGITWKEQEKVKSGN